MSRGTEEVWLVTGASSGLGRSIVERALEAGHRVVATARSAGSLDDLAAEWKEHLWVLRLDVLDAEGCAAVIDAVLTTYGRIDVLVNNAGRAQIGAIEETSNADLRALFDLHVFAPMTLTRLVLPAMRARGSGLIIQMSSMGSVLIKPGFGAYSATKAALEALSATLAAEVAGFGVGVLIVQPGSHRTRVFAPESRYMVPAMPEYSDILSEVRHFVDDADGDQPGDPDLAAAAIVRLAGERRRPLRLALGADAVRLIEQGLADMSAELSEWTSVSVTTARADAAEPGSIADRHQTTRARTRAEENS